MPSATAAATYVVGFFLVASAAVVGSKLLTGDINTTWLLYGKRPRGKYYFSPERVQLLAVTVWVAFNYLLTVVNNPAELPDVKPETLALLGGSHALYLGGKVVSRLLPDSTPLPASDQKG